MDSSNPNDRLPGEGWTLADIIILVIGVFCIAGLMMGWFPEG